MRTQTNEHRAPSTLVFLSIHLFLTDFVHRGRIRNLLLLKSNHNILFVPIGMYRTIMRFQLYQLQWI